MERKINAPESKEKFVHTVMVSRHSHVKVLFEELLSTYFTIFHRTSIVPHYSHAI